MPVPSGSDRIFRKGSPRAFLQGTAAPFLGTISSHPASILPVTLADKDTFRDCFLAQIQVKPSKGNEYA